jgi:hypothetical protein
MAVSAARAIPPFPRVLHPRLGRGRFGRGRAQAPKTGQLTAWSAHDKIDIPPPAPLRNQLDLRCGGTFGRGRS